MCPSVRVSVYFMQYSFAEAFKQCNKAGKGAERVWEGCKAVSASKQASKKQAGEQAGKQVGKQVDKPASKQASRQAIKQASR